MKRAIRYLRFSKDKQSNHSIAYQDKSTAAWCSANNVEVIDTFTDEGKSARTFEDRPDFDRLEAFIKKYSGTIDYLVVDEFSRFSRETGAAMVKIKHYQLKYKISIVSATQSLIYNANDSGSHIQTGINFLLNEADNITRTNKIKAGINAGHLKGRYFHVAPVGYINARDENNQPILKVNEAKCDLIKTIYADFISGKPLYKIAEDAKRTGLNLNGNSSITRILTNPVYAGMIRVTEYKGEPEKLVPGIHEPIIMRSAWLQVQQMLKGGNEKRIIDDRFPLRGVLHCQCGKLLTAAESSGRNNKYPYYKGNCSCGTNINATFAHGQLQQIWEEFSLPADYIEYFIETYNKQLSERMRDSQREVFHKERELSDAIKRRDRQEKLFIDQQIKFETYERQHAETEKQISLLKAEIRSLESGYNERMQLITEALPLVSDINKLYSAFDTTMKQEFVKTVFDNSLGYQNKTYRTRFVMHIFEHKAMTLKEKNLLILDTMNDKNGQIPLGGAGGTRIEHFLRLIVKIKAA